MELEFGHGFMPRVGEDNYKAVDRCIGPADLFTEDPLTLPWAIIDGAWAEGRPELLDTLKANDTNEHRHRSAPEPIYFPGGCRKIPPRTYAMPMR